MSRRRPKSLEYVMAAAMEGHRRNRGGRMRWFYLMALLHHIPEYALLVWNPRRNWRDR